MTGSLTRGFAVLASLGALLLGAPSPVSAEQASSVALARFAGLLDSGFAHTCAVLAGGTLRCWGDGSAGKLGYGNTADIGDNESPASVGPVDFGPGRSVRAVSAGMDHTCAILDDASVRCWGQNEFGQLGLGHTEDVGDNETPASVPAVQIGGPGTAVAIATGSAFTCALRSDAQVICWGIGTEGRLGYGNTSTIGDDEHPSAAGPVDLGIGRTAQAILSGNGHACAILDFGSVRCWGNGGPGSLGYSNTDDIGDNELPSSTGPVSLGVGLSARAAAAGAFHTCAIRDTSDVLCWGEGADGRLGYGNVARIGDTEHPSSAGAVDIGSGRTALAIANALNHTCVILDSGAVRCWGTGGSGALGLGNTDPIGDTETPGSVGPVDLGAGRTARAVTGGAIFTCALLDDGTVRCWGAGTDGRLGQGSTAAVGDDETPAAGPLTDLGGVLTAATGDASLTVSADTPNRLVGENLRLTAVLASAGLDPLPSASVSVRLPAGLQLLDARPGAGAFASGFWSVPSLAAGTTASLDITARLVAPGDQVATVELTSAAPFFHDADSTPGNGAAGEDDQASVLITAAPNPPPVLSALSLQRRVFVVGRAPTAPSSARRLARGTRFRFRLSELSDVTIRFERALAGRRAGRRCVAPPRRPKGRPCARFKPLRQTLLRRGLAAGRQSVAFSGRIGRRPLVPGSYRATLTPVDLLGVGGAPRRIRFVVRIGRR